MATNIVSSLGAGSGIDTTSLISGLVAAERAPTESRLDTRQTKLEAQISAYGTLKSALSTFQGLLSPLANNDTFNARSVALPDTTVITANSLDAGAQPGTYQIEVADVARAHTLALPTVEDKNSALGASGTLTLQLGDWTYDVSKNPSSFAVNDERAAINITIEATDTLVTLAQKINDSDSGIQASVLSVDGQNQLMLTAPSGASNALQITSDDVSLVDFEYNAINYAGVTETQQASDALIYLNGLAITRETNIIGDVIPGLSFTLNKSSEGEKLSFTIEEDTAIAEQAVRDFVDGYNVLYQSIKNLTSVTEDPDTGETVPGGLATDGSAKALFSQLRSMISQTVPGVDDGFTALTNIGIRTELDGTLAISEDEFLSGFSDNFDLVESLFATTLQSDNPYVIAKAGSYVSRATPGSYAINITVDPSQGNITGNALTLANFDAVTDTLSASFDASVSDYSFKISVNGTMSDSISLTGTYSTIDEVRAELQSLINGDVNLKAARAEVDVSYDTATDSFTFTSRDYGSSSEISFSEVSSSAEELGLSTALTGTAGVDVAGTIDGLAGFGSGNVLLPDLESDVYGLNFTIRPGASAVGSSSLSFSRGFAGELNQLIQRFLASDGLISSREDNINSQLDDVSDDREELNLKMEKYEARISAQFYAMERIISSLQSTGDSLTGILDRLPFTANRN